MQKSTKRLLSMLMVLALVLTLAPAGILAVETKAEVQSNLPAGVAATMATEAAKQTTAKAALAALTGADAAARVAELNTDLTTCPFCGIEGVTWEAVKADAVSYGGTGAKGRHYYAYGTISKTVSNAFHCSADGADFCLLMDNATINTTGRVLLNKTGCVVNIGGTGTFRSTMASLVGGDFDTAQNGMFHLMGGSTVNLYGGNFINDCNTTHFSKYSGFNRALIHSYNGSAVTNIWSDDVVLGPQEAGTTAKLNVRVQYGTVNMYAGTIQNSYVTQGWTQGWNVFIQSGTFNMYGGTVKDGKGGTTTKGGNVCLYQADSRFNMYGGTVTGGVAQDGGNIYMAANSEAKLNGLVEKGSASNQGGNVSVQAGATLKLGNVDLKNGIVTGSATLSSNVRLWGANLNLYGKANVPGNILMTSADSISVEPTFSGETYVWQTAGVTLGAAVVNSTATGGHTGHVYNGAWKSAVAANGATDVYIPVEMVWDGATGLEYPLNGVVYNGSLRGAASAQAAVDAFVAAMADEEIEEKPQYVMIAGDVNIGENEVVIDPLDNIFVYGSGTVYGVDRANDTYAATSGSISVFGPAVASDVTAGGRHFVALKDGDAYTFHRVKADLVSVTVNVDKAGLYYKAEYKFDEAVKARVQSYGVLVALNEEATKNSLKTSSEDLSGYADATLTAASHGVYGIFKTTNDDATNIANGESELNGNPYLAIDLTGEGEATIIDATNVAMSMAGAMELANEKWEALDETAQANLNTFVGIWKNAFSPETLEKLTNFTIN